MGEGITQARARLAAIASEDPPHVLDSETRAMLRLVLDAAAPPPAGVQVDREALHEAILSARWPNGDRIDGLGTPVADLIAAALAPLLGSPGETRPEPGAEASRPCEFCGTERCHAGRDGDCLWAECPQQRDGEPVRSGRHCPLDCHGPWDENACPLATHG